MRQNCVGNSIRVKPDTTRLIYDSPLQLADQFVLIESRSAIVIKRQHEWSVQGCPLNLVCVATKLRKAH